jgi:HEAT repeat protein
MPGIVSSFANHSLSEWTEDLQHATSAENRYRALLAVSSLGSLAESVRWSRHSLQDTDSGVRALAAKQLGESKTRDTPTSIEWTAIAGELATLLRDDDPDVRFETARSLGRIDPNHSTAREVLLSLLDDDGIQPLMIAAVVSALRERSDVDTAVLVLRYRSWLTHERAEVRESVAAAVSSWDARAAAMVEELVVALDDEEPLVREHAAMALGRARVASEKVFAALREAASDEDEGVAAAAETALRSLTTG